MNPNDRVASEKAILVGLNADCFKPEETATDASLDELEALLETAGGICVAKVLQNRHTPDPHSFIGEGKAEEVRQLVESSGATLVVFDNDLSPAQIRSLEELTQASVLDRSALILDIFAQRAKTAEGRLQVELYEPGALCQTSDWKPTAATSASGSPDCRTSWPRCARSAQSSGNGASRIPFRWWRLWDIQTLESPRF